jgi:hypothetical protein
MAVTFLLWGLLFYSHAQANTVTFTRATRDVGGKMRFVLSYSDDDDYDSGDDDYDSGDDDDGGDDDGDDD